ncbi:MAG: hypothetical protein P9L97_06130 [Candidatus Tenebribacter davisii]|nr:hypothetical protein [Candidatus Tenebribacter davisii]
MNKLLENLKDKLQDRRTSEKILEITIAKLEKNLIHMENLNEARAIFQKASQVTQTQLSEQISGIVTSALSAVGFPYSFVVEFVERRNTTEADLWFEQNGKRKKPLDSCGYGAADIASLALRVAYWKLDGEARNVLALDEPTRNLSVDKQPLASMMIRELSRMEGGLQFIIVTHQKALAESADRLFTVVKENYISHVTQKEIENAN